MATADILTALNFAAYKHRNQRRKCAGNYPYINHPVRVAQLMSEIGNITEPIPLICALLHDTIEDTDATYEEIVALYPGRPSFTDAIVKVVSEVTDDKSLPKVRRKELQIINAPSKSYYAKLVKLCDKLDNLSDISDDPPKDWSPKRCYGYFVWAYEVVQGLRGTNKALEDKLDEIFKRVLGNPSRDSRFKELNDYYASLVENQD